MARESGGVRTQVRFAGNRIVAPVAFQGSYNASLLGCIRFEGWADTTINLGFDAARQTLTARVDIRQVNLQGIPQLAAGSLTQLVQNSIDRRVNPIQILRAEQLAARFPLGDNNTLQPRRRRHGGTNATVLTDELCQLGYRAERAYDRRSMRSQMKAADRSGAALAVIYAPDELADGSVVVRRLRDDGEQFTVPIDGLATTLAEHIDSHISNTGPNTR
ncbi:MAG: His/Gly/Thr/Pro-type tRNA ligase C-terminal domain-containing protein [Ilumatobacteraceae bacterium]